MLTQFLRVNVVVTKISTIYWEIFEEEYYHKFCEYKGVCEK